MPGFVSGSLCQINTSIDKIQDYKWSPAEVSQILFKNFDKPEKSLEDLVKLNPQSLFRF